ncbi:MurR/RpiR family transcriptional regulator [Aquibacillus sp. 3ASR75-11]|uniref:MurR/RpiR family transcriptional regulator n=1 Tax=Terrihalobacillus insolitus TaxID=2950438 RepID=A0A9X3WTW0_9BACI|nr:MurR/RpiR family transcriptional regulator [Terrihalobacillus insolitus]MDC3413820.1 MurR/RpiR family transcriptional regulator [Terrihalobacillus insolitus]MDC3424533.1 MurR/RpiR family transcriptional regulator [Terrihalobacillus insolitus]
MVATQTKKPIKGIINSYYPSLTKSAQKVADFVLENLDQVMYYSVTDLADEVGVGETTVLRFCKKIGFKGYQEFKLSIAQNVPNEQESDEPESPNLIQSISTNTIQAIKHTASMISESDLNSAVRLLEDANSIHFFGVGTSGLTALDAKSRFLRIGRRTESITDSHLQAMTAATLSEGDVVVGISVSGSTRDTVRSLEIAKENGAKIIAITYYSRSPITQLANIVLNGGGKESPLEGGSLTAKMSQLFVIDLLCTGMALLNKDSSIDMKRKTASAVVDKIY